MFQVNGRNSMARWLLVYFGICLLMMAIDATVAIGAGGSTLPSANNQFDKFTAAGTLMNLVDSFLFSLGARFLAGIALLGAAWNLKEQRFSMAIICIFAAIMLGTIPLWVRNIFSLDIGGGSIFTN